MSYMEKCHFMIVIFAFTARGQAQRPVNFDVATVRVSSSEPPRRGMPARGDMLGGPGTDDPTRITYTWVTMSSILAGAFGSGGDRILNVPDWTDTERYDLRAIVPAAATKEQVQQMMQNLLRERFHLAFHRDEKAVASCELVIDKGGSKLKQAAPADGGLPPPFGLGGPVVLDRDGFPILPPGYTRSSRITSNPPGVVRETYRKGPIGVIRGIVIFARIGCTSVIDKTGLTGDFDFHLEYADPAINGKADQAITPSDPAPDLATALEQQLGLRLVKSAVKLDVVVIDHLDKKPTEN